MKISHTLESLEENAARTPTRDEMKKLLERRKCSLLHEMKLLSARMHKYIESGAVSQQNDDNAKNADKPKIPDSETRRILSTDPKEIELILKVFERFAYVREILSNTVMYELEQIEEAEKAEKAEKEGTTEPRQQKNINDEMPA